MKEICETLKSRFLLMEKITLYKFIHNLPLCDKERERLMLDDIYEKAVLLNLCKDGVADFFESLMSISKRVQSNIMCRYYYDEKFTCATMANIADIRSEIDAINMLLLKNIESFYQETYDLKPENFFLFCETLDVSHMSIMDKKELFDRLQNVKLN